MDETPRGRPLCYVGFWDRSGGREGQTNSGVGRGGVGLVYSFSEIPGFMIQKHL